MTIFFDDIVKLRWAKEAEKKMRQSTFTCLDQSFHIRT